MSDQTVQASKDSESRSVWIAIIATFMIAVILIMLISLPARYGGIKGFFSPENNEPVQYPVVLVHGLGGFGEDRAIADMQYWGATTGSLPDYLRGQGYTVYAPSVGPFSSTWDRTCELYAQLTGTTVDYGEAHAKAHGHARFGRAYDTALVPDWGVKTSDGQRVKIHLISHSFGGETVRMLTSLLAYGNEAERKASGKDVSGLFKGGKSDWVFSVTTICAPHNGSALTCIVDELGSVAGIDNTTDLLVDLLFKILKMNTGSAVMPDLMLDQFGIVPGSKSSEEISEALKKIETAGNDHAFYELSPDGAAQLNTQIRMADNVYYFSYAYSTTKAGTRIGGMVPEKKTMPLLYPLALLLGGYHGTTPGGIAIDESWQDNDGLVSIVSAQYPTKDPHENYTPDVKPRPGVWYVMPTLRGDHSSPAGMSQPVSAYHQMFTDMLARVEGLR